MLHDQLSKTLYSLVQKRKSVFVEASRRIIRTDQPGRVVAVFVVSPILAYKGIMYDDHFIKGFSFLLFSWDLWWLVMKKPVGTSH